MSQTIDFAKAALATWAREHARGHDMGLGYAQRSQEGKWMEEGINPPVKHKPPSQSYSASLADRVHAIWQAMVDKKAKKVLKIHYRYGHMPLEERLKDAGCEKSEYYRRLNNGHWCVAREL